MANKVKVIGYAKKEFYTDGIEYRNFSPDLVGNQIASNEGTPIFTSGNFNISTNLDGKVDKTFVRGKVVWDGKEIVSEPGWGKYVPASDLT